MKAKCVAAVVEAPGRMALREFDLPRIGDDDGLLRVEMVGVCGTDPKLFHRQIPDRAECPFILGHEMVGYVEELGPVAAERWHVKKGSRVIVDPLVGCGHCRHCLTGNARFCRSVIGYGSHTSCARPPSLWGGYSQYVYLPPNVVLHEVSSQVSAEAAVLVTTAIANGIRWARTKGGITLQSSVVVLGAGSQGLAAVIAAREAGAYPIIAAGLPRDHERLELALVYGADHVVDVERVDLVDRVREVTGGEMADVVVDVTGSPAAAAISLDLVRVLGTVVNAGLSGGHPAAMNADKIVMKEITYLGAYTHDVPSVEAAIRLIETGKYPLEKMVTHRFGLEEAERAVRMVGGEIEGEYPTKVVLVP